MSLSLSAIPAGTVWAIALVLAVTALVAVALRHRTVRMVMVVPIYGLAIAGGLAAMAAYNRLQLQREYDTCADRVTRSDGNRDQHLAIYALLDRELGNTRIGDELRAALDVNLPDRSIQECDPP